jgi:hypothetical protein
MAPIASILAALVIGFTVLPGTTIKIDQKHAWVVSEVLAFSEVNKTVTVKLSEAMVDGTDYNCAVSSRLFHEICSQGYRLLVKPAIIGGWVPSAVNPMTIEWTRVLVGEAPDKRIEPAKIGESRKRGRSYGVKPTGKTSRYEVNGTDVYIRKKD